MNRCHECGSWEVMCGSDAPVPGCGCARCANARADRAEARVAELEAKNAEWEQKARNWMATPEAAARLDGYREMAARVAELEEILAEAVCYDWEPECPPEELRERIDKALAGRKED